MAKLIHAFSHKTDTKNVGFFMPLSRDFPVVNGTGSPMVNSSIFCGALAVMATALRGLRLLMLPPHPLQQQKTSRSQTACDNRRRCGRDIHMHRPAPLRSSLQMPVVYADAGQCRIPYGRHWLDSGVICRCDGEALGSIVSGHDVEVLTG